jgi:hypothetical protein
VLCQGGSAPNDEITRFYGVVRVDAQHMMDNAFLWIICVVEMDAHRFWFEKWK